MPYKRLSRFSRHFVYPKFWLFWSKPDFFNRHESRVENRRRDGSLPVGVRLGFHLVPSIRFDLVRFPVPAHRTRTGSFPASGSRERLTRSPTEDSRYGVVIGPNHTQNEGTLPGTVCIPAVLHGVCRRATDAAFGAHVDRPRCRLC